MNIQWYPGHMTKAMRNMQGDIKLVDLVIEVVDSRLPISSRNPDIDKLINTKSRILILNKSDLSDEKLNNQWKEYFEKSGAAVLLLDSRKTSNSKIVAGEIDKARKVKSEKDKKRGILNRPLRVMVVGIPNVGKSTLINSLAKKAAAKIGDKPGVTKGNQWIKLSKGVELLDTPGLLWPKFEDEEVGIKLALAGSINDNIIDQEELAYKGVSYLCEHYAGAIKSFYNVSEDDKPYEILTNIAVSRNLIKSGSAPDTLRAAKMFLEDLRSAKIERITFEQPKSRN